MQQLRSVAFGILLLAVFSSGMAQQPSAMRLILLGTGYPYPNAERAGPSCAIIAGSRVFVVDAGRGTVMRLAAVGIPWSAVNTVFLTHLHSDHIDGLPDLFHCAWQFGDNKPLDLYGPEGTKSIADAVLQFYEPDIHIRRDLTEMLPAESAAIHAHEIQEGVVYEIPGEIRVTAFLVDHHPVNPAFGYRFDAGPHSIVVTGDTRPNPNLIKYAKGADILVHEAYVRGDSPSPSPGKQRWSIYDYHSSAAEAGETAEKAKARILVLTHLIPAGASEKEFLDESGTKFHGKIIVGRDLMVISPPEPSDKP